MFFEDFIVGQRSRFGHYEVMREEVVDFARRYDPQPFHLSDEGAAGTPFGRLAASGWHTAAMTMAMVVGNMTEMTGNLGAAEIRELRWHEPVYPGDTLRAESTVIEARRSRSKPDRGVVHLRTETFNQHDRPVMSFTAIVFYRCRDGG